MKTLSNTLPDEHVCECEGATPRQVLDAQLAELQAYIDGGGCLRSWFLEAGIIGLVSTAVLAADTAGALNFDDGSNAGLVELRASLLPFITPELVQYVAGVVAAIWAAPPAGGLS